MKQDNHNQNVPIEDLPRLPDPVIEAYKQRKLVIFIGAGISRLMGCQGWDELANSLVYGSCKPGMADQIINSRLDSIAKITIARRYSEKNGTEDLFWSKFKKAISADPEKEDIYETISYLASTFITTNCDGLLVKHFPNSYTTQCTIESFSENRNKPFVFCIHGHYGEGSDSEKNSLVFTIDEYLKKYASGSDLSEFLFDVMHNHNVLFLGYGLNEFGIISRAFAKGEDITQKHFILEGFFEYQQELANAQAEYYKSLGVKLIPYRKDENGYDQQCSIIKKWVEQLYQDTTYVSRGIETIIDALKDCSDSNQDIIKNYISRTDGKSVVFLRSVLEAIPKSKPWAEWIRFLIEHGFIKPEDLPEIENTENGIKRVHSDYLASIIECLYSNTENSIEDIKDIVRFVEECIRFAANNDLIIKNTFVVEQLVEVTFLLKIHPNAHIKTLWRAWAKTVFDNGYSLIERHVDFIKSFERDALVEFFSAVFKLGVNDTKEKRDAGIWFEKIAHLMSKELDEEAISAFLANYSKQVLSDIGDDDFYLFIEERFQYHRNSYGYHLFKAVEILNSSLSDRGKQLFCRHLVRAANTSYVWQVTLYYCKLNGFSDLSAFNSNPLNLRSTYVDFYCWIELLVDMNKLNIEYCDTIAEWIKTAEIGYSLEKEDKYYYDKKRRIDTKKYQLFALLVRVDSKYNSYKEKYEKNADTNYNTPSENLEQYYQVRSLEEEKYFPTNIPDTLTGEELFDLIEKEVSLSNWQDKELVYRDVYEEFFEVCSDKQLNDYINLIIKKPVEKNIRFLKSLISEGVLRKCGNNSIRKMIENSIEKAGNPQNSIQERKDLADCLITIMDCLNEMGWQYEEILEYIENISIQKICPAVSSINPELDYPTNILNITECIYYKIYLECVAACNDNSQALNRFKEWYVIERKSERAFLLRLTFALYYGLTRYLDDNWSKNFLLKDFQNTEYKDILSLCMCFGVKFISKEMIEFIIEGDNIEKTIELVKSDKKDSRYSTKVFSIFVAARQFELIDDVIYRRFIKAIPDNEIRDALWSALFAVEDIHESKKLTLFNKTYRMFDDSQIVIASDALVSVIKQLDNLKSYSWKLIEKALKTATNDINLWFDLRMCISKTKKGNQYIKKAFMTLTDSSKNLYVPHFLTIDDILANLGRLKEFESVKLLAGYLVKNNVFPTKYSKYVENPNDVLKDFKGHIVD